jgi:hypothetical protein
MELLLQRRTKGAPVTRGRLEIIGRFQCDTLELPEPILAGTYPLDLTVSGRAQHGSLWTPWSGARLPEILDVPGRTAIRIHAGNSVRDTQLCVLVGFDWLGDQLVQSRAALTELERHLRLPAYITITDPKE